MAVSGNITRRTLRAALTPRTKAVIVVHLAGWPCDMDPLLEAAAATTLEVIEDCAQSHGADLQGRVTGSIGPFGAFSFCQDKIVTTAAKAACS
jgi:dTDP-4-amino-4,6-dideoxygalactose transaminase